MHIYIQTLSLMLFRIILTSIVILMLAACSTHTIKTNTSIPFRDLYINTWNKSDNIELKTRRKQAGFSCANETEKLDLSKKATIDVSFLDADIREALLELSMISNVAIIADDSVEGLISVDLHGKSLESSLRIVISPGNYSYKIMKDFVFVGTANPESASFHLLSDTCNYRPRHINPSNVISLLQPYYKNFVTINDSHGTISIVAPNNIQDRIQADIIALDRQPDQVILEMSIVEISTEALKYLGINWGQLKNIHGGINQNRINLSNSGQQNISINQTTKVLSIPLIRALHFLESEGKAVIRATPSIVTLDGHVAEFSSTKKSWLQLDGSNSNRIIEVNYGIHLKLIPRIADGGAITLNIIQASVSDLLLNENHMPKIVSHSVSSFVHINDGETLVLGGLLQKIKYIEKSQIPILGSIPILGWLFKYEREQINEIEVVIIITPKIMKKAG